MCSRLGIPKPPRGFWAKVKAGEVPHPQGRLPEGVSSSINVITLEEAGNADERVLKRYNGHARCHSSANRRLKRWMKKHGWDRLRACHEMRSYNGAMVTTMTGSLYETQKRLRHAGNPVPLKSPMLTWWRTTRMPSAFPMPARFALVSVRPRWLRLAGFFVRLHEPHCLAIFV